jgi:hypothetical protein
VPNISFPKNSSSKVNKIVIDEDEPLFSESNLNTSRNISALNGNDNDSTKLTFSTNKISSKLDNKNITESTRGKKEIYLEGLSSTDTNNNKIMNKTTKNRRASTDSTEIINNQINFNNIINFNDKKKKAKSRNINSNLFRIKKKKLNSYDNKYEKNNFDENSNFSKEKNNRPLELSSYDDIFRKKNQLPGDFVPFKSKDELKTRHVNIVSSEEIFDEPKIIKVYPSIDFNEIKKSRILNYIKLGDNPRFMYINYYHNNQKTHKSKLLTLIK